ncbi:DNA mismatch repair protein MutS [Litoreibacter roseus]|nr:DNA mismatch repair protein MutS [Litoreibacter roseus]
MMAQFLEIKAQYKDALLFYRMGDFYEMFFEDAVAAAEALDIALTKRGKHQGEDIPMCGVPVHAAENYLLTLIRKGFRVAVCEQLESPAEAKKRGYKSVVKRDVVRLVTPGTLTEETLLEARKHNYLVAYSNIRDDGALAWVDISTGELHVTPCPQVKISPELARLAPREVLVSDNNLNALEGIAAEVGASVTALAPGSFDSASASARLTKFFSVKSTDAFGQFSRPEISALGALLDYLELTQKGQLPSIRPPVREDHRSIMQIDPATRRNLEITQTIQGERKGSLLSVIDRTMTAGGARLLFKRLSAPLVTVDPLHQRLACVTYFVDQPYAIEPVRDTLRKIPDIDRALSRLSVERGGPRDLAAIRDGLDHASRMSDLFPSTETPEILTNALASTVGHDDIVSHLSEALVAEPPLLARDGGFVSAGYDPDLDEARKLRDDGRKVIAELQATYSGDTGISALKIKHNNVLGYFIETPAGHASKMMSEPLSTQFIHRQTTANAVRFTTNDLSELETKILNAGERALSIEARVFAELQQRVVEAANQIGAVADALAEIDLYAAFADLAIEKNWCKPSVDTSRIFDVVDGRHPVVEAALQAENSGPFVANSCDLTARENSAAIWLLTGPNMAGKSTFLRQNALIALLAQIGSYVPATSAHIGLVSQLFSRVGASDDLARGRSTFMVEMVETAAILNQADERAMVILDEIGRGTATYDGLSIAWATLEHLHSANSCRALFATHYHELTALSESLPGVENATVTVKDWENEIIFLHEVRKGASDRSYGVQVAKLAGLPASVVDRARVVLDQLEAGEREGGGRSKELLDDLPLFSTAPAPQVTAAASSQVEDRLEDVIPDDLSPREALQLVYELKALARR